MTDTIETDLRALVRELIGEILPEVAHVAQQPELRTVRLDNDDDITAFVALILDLAQDRDELRRLRSGRLCFSLAPASGVPQASAESSPLASTPTPAQVQGPVLRIERGAVTERTLAHALANGSRVLLGKGAVVTPLARELARNNGMRLERES
ncbi:MAG: hypothetical protein QM655_07535 [Nocardioidaceae bacterium]